MNSAEILKELKTAEANYGSFGTGTISLCLNWLDAYTNAVITEGGRLTTGPRAATGPYIDALKAYRARFRVDPQGAYTAVEKARNDYAAFAAARAPSASTKPVVLKRVARTPSGAVVPVPARAPSPAQTTAAAATAATAATAPNVPPTSGSSLLVDLGKLVLLTAPAWGVYLLRGRI